MEHPFTANMEINPQQANNVSGGRRYLVENIKGSYLAPDPVVKPRNETTMAIGEEGGSIGQWF